MQRTIDKMIDLVQSELHFPDPIPVYALIGAVAGTYLPGSPVWLMLIGPPGCAKTELLRPLIGLEHFHLCGALTEASLLSGTPKKEKNNKSTGGMLRKLGEFGFLVLKDFTSVLSMSRDNIATTLAALREISDGKWVRALGSDGGREEKWEGKCGFLAGCTPEIDRQHSLITSMGQRFVSLRFDVAKGVAEARQGLRLEMDAAKRERWLRMGGEVMGQVVGEIRESIEERRLRIGTRMENRVLSMGWIGATARGVVHRDIGSKLIDYDPMAEYPTRMSAALGKIGLGLMHAGLTEDEVFEVQQRVMWDSMPPLRCRLLKGLYAGGKSGVLETELAGREVISKGTVGRSLEELKALGLVDRKSAGIKGKKTMQWELSATAKREWRIAFESQEKRARKQQAEEGGEGEGYE